MTRVLDRKITVDSLWFGLLMLYIVTGYFAQDVLLPATVNSLVLYAFLGYSVFAIVCSTKVKITPIFKWGIASLAFAFVAMLYSPDFSLLSGTYYALIVNFVLVFIFTQMPWNEKRFRAVLGVYVASAAFLMVALAATGNLQDSSESGRLGQELTGNANILAMMLMVGAIYAIWLLVSSRRRLSKMLSTLALIAIYFGMFLSGGRKYVIVPVVFAYILLLCKSGKKGRWKWIKYTLLIALVAVALYYLIMKVPFFYESIGSRFDSFFGAAGAEEDTSAILRQQMTEAAWDKWPESPIWGHGFDSFKYYNAEHVTGKMFYSHNNFLELLYNQGLIGFIAYYSLYVYLFVKAWKMKGAPLKKGFVLATIVSLLCFEYFGITYSITPAQTMLFFCVLCARGGSESDERKSKANGENKNSDAPVAS